MDGEPLAQHLRELGRGVLVAPGADAPEGWDDAPRIALDDAALRRPGPALDELHSDWSQRRPVVVEIGCGVGALRAPEHTLAAPYSLPPTFEFAIERLYFLARANNYDHRAGRMVWGPAIEAQRLGATIAAFGPADVGLADGTPAFVDGGPRGLTLDGVAVVHRNTVEQGALTPDRAATSDAELAPDQRDAVSHEAGAARVIAPAGSGKTRVLTERFRLLTTGRAWHPGSLTAVAYNVRAKDTMQQRLAGVPDASRRRVRTLHSLGNAIVRSAVGAATLLDEWEMRRRIEALVPVKPRANTDVLAPYLEALGEVRLGLVDPHAVEARRDDVAGFATMFGEYREKLRADHALDHDEQIYGALEVLLRDAAIRREFQRECRHLLVDEFQDLTPAQLLMLRLLAAPAYDVFGVGDDDQVVYGYAGADPEFLINYDRYFPGGTHHALQHNYRCPGAVVAAARNLLSYNARRIAKEIVAAKPLEPDTCTVERAPAEQLATVAVAGVRAWLDAGAAPTEIAVLGRVNAALAPVQVLLGEAGVACWTPVSVAVLNRTGTRTALAYLRLALAAANGSPYAGSDVAIAIRRPSRSLRREIVQRLEKKRHWRPAQLREAPYGLSTTSADRFELFCDDLEALGAAIAGGASTAQVLRRIRDDIGLGAALATLDLSGKSPDASHRDDLNALIAVAELQPEPDGFEAWLRTRLRAAHEPPGSDGVAVSTVHRVKGMEWPYVVVLGAHDGSMPHALADDLEEERRIFHVAITRCDTAVHVVADATAPAPFLDELTTPAPAGYVAPSRRTTARAAAPVPAVAAAPTSELARTVDALKVWRRERAQADKVPAFVVLSDTHLAGIAAEAPTTLSALAGCAGIGPTKLERYGDEIIAVIASLAQR